ncbi:MAG: hypothetical protein AAGA48_34490 [Myxococcota bacterium]
MSTFVELVAWIGLTPVVTVALCATLFGAGLPLVLVLGVYGRATEQTASRRATATAGGALARTDRSAA